MTALFSILSDLFAILSYSRIHEACNFCTSIYFILSHPFFSLIISSMIRNWTICALYCSIDLCIFSFYFRLLCLCVFCTVKSHTHTHTIHTMCQVMDTGHHGLLSFSLRLSFIGFGDASREMYTIFILSDFQ